MVFFFRPARTEAGAEQRDPRQPERHAEGAAAPAQHAGGGDAAGARRRGRHADGRPGLQLRRRGQSVGGGGGDVTKDGFSRGDV